MNKTFYREKQKSFQKVLERYSHITILTHKNPDGDTIGTALGLASILKKAGKRVEVISTDSDIPPYLDFLAGFKRILQKPQYTSALLISCDCGSVDRLGIEYDGRELVNIDHHRSNTEYGTLNIIDPDAASASEVAFRLCEDLFSIGKDAASAFYAALLLDTQSFTTSSVSKKSFELAERLIEHGADPVEIAQMVLQRRSLASLRILGRAINALRLYDEGRIAIMKIRREDILSTGARMSDMDGLVDYGRSLATVETAVVLIELEGKIKASIRSKHRDISKVAVAFGGGGHKNAAGFELLNIDIDEVAKKLLDVLKKENI